MRLTFEKLTELTKHLAGAIYRDAIPLTGWRIVDNLDYGTPLPPDDDPAWQPLLEGSAWGGRLRWAWMKAAATIPADFAGKPVALRIQFEPLRGTPETQVFSPPEALVAISGIDTPPQTIEFARALKEMRDYGMGWKELSAITGKTEEYIRNYVRLIEQGEERLVKGVEDGVFSLNFAMNVAQSNDRSIQHLLMDAFDSGIVNSNNLPRVRKIIEDRLEKGKTLGSRRSNTTYTVDKLKRDIRKITREKEAFVYEAGQRENRLMRILVALQRLRKDGSFLAMLKTAGLAEPPQLKGQYAV